ncbi:MAG: TIGR01212 family radical SAM protein [Oscillospiraceae bacterium]|nr:TIGR01212 family radical SAM protein [Oscillospiraceae bacterium]
MDFRFTLDNKRYHTYNYFLRTKFGGKVMKISLNGGFTCPNIDGTKGVGGCTYCSSSGSGDFAGDPSLDIHRQFEEVKAMMTNKWEGKYIAYFQANTNTYAPLSRLKPLYESALSEKDVIGLSIATRADCISEEIADYLKELSEKTYLTVELGLQTIHDKTGERINRCHSYADFLKGYNMIKDRKIPVCVHLINGLPGETHEMMVETAREVGKLSPDFVKLHLLHIIKGTKIAEEFERGEFSLMTLPEYVSVICDQLEVLPQETVIQRVTGDGKKEDLIGPMWSLKKFVVMNEIDKEMVRRNSCQGIKV